MAEGTFAKIDHEVHEIDDLLSSYAPLLASTQARTPDLTETSAVATVLHSFYGGIENIFTIVAKEIDKNLPTGANWHRSLLEQMTRSNQNRMPVIDETDEQILLEYLSFRHFFRHAYSFRLDWEQMRSLAADVSANWARIKTRIQSFHAHSEGDNRSTK